MAIKYRRPQCMELILKWSGERVQCPDPSLPRSDYCGKHDPEKIKIREGRA